MPAVDSAIADTGAFDTAANARVFGALVDVFDGFQTAPQSQDTLAHDLAGGERISRIQDIALANVPAIDAHAFGKQVHNAFDGEMCLVGAEAAHGPAGGIVGEYSLRFGIHVRHPI